MEIELHLFIIIPPQDYLSFVFIITTIVIKRQNKGLRKHVSDKKKQATEKLLVFNEMLMCQLFKTRK